MKRYLIVSLLLLPLLLLSFSLSSAWAERGHRYPGKSHVIDKRHHHNHYYPRRGSIVSHIPSRHHRVLHHGSRFYFSSGVWYRPYGARYTVVAPPIGVVIPILPRSYTTVWYGDEPYYYAAGAYYRWYPAERGYVVVNPPEDVTAYQEPEVPDELFVYPSAGQSEELQATDRYECHRWAADESGFDPTRAGGGVPAEENYTRRSNYNRATKACVEARGYSVE